MPNTKYNVIAMAVRIKYALQKLALFGLVLLPNPQTNIIMMFTKGTHNINKVINHSFTDITSSLSELVVAITVDWYASLKLIPLFCCMLCNSVGILIQLK